LIDPCIIRRLQPHQNPWVLWNRQPLENLVQILWT
jgi:hypothetical protein